MLAKRASIFFLVQTSTEFETDEDYLMASRKFFDSCVVVGNSNTLSESRMGTDIDSNYTAIFRFNNAPTKGFEQLVGSRTTFQ